MNRGHLITAGLLGVVLGFNSAPSAIAGEASQAPKLNGGQLYVDYACSSCHGAGGRNGLPGYPRLAAQDPIYLIEQLTAFKSGKRSYGMAQTMVGIVAQIPDDELRAISFYLSKQGAK